MASLIEVEESLFILNCPTGYHVFKLQEAKGILKKRKVSGEDDCDDNDDDDYVPLHSSFVCWMNDELRDEITVVWWKERMMIEGNFWQSEVVGDG